MLKALTFLGLALIVLGVALVPLPGPGYPILAAGVVLAGVSMAVGRADQHRS